MSFFYDTAGRMNSLSSAATSYATAASVSSMTYAPHGGLASETHGNALVHAITYNSRLQPDHIKLGTVLAPTSVLDIEYTYSNSDPNIHDNNGNVRTQKITAGAFLLTQTYTYDELNRLSSASEKTGSETNPRWMQSYGYDRFGNRTSLTNTGEIPPQTAPGVDPATNRLIGFPYDAAGNLTQYNSQNCYYDAESRMVLYAVPHTSSSYRYDGEGRRVFRHSFGPQSGTTVYYVYDIAGMLIADYTSGPFKPSSQEYVYGASGLLATIQPGNGTTYLTADHLGSPRVATNASQAVVSRHDYLPFGEELSAGIGSRTAGMGYGATDGVRQQFTQKERDNESGLDYFLARYYSSAQGRFTGVDRLMGSALDPQTLNRYSYVANNPLKRTDPDGLYPRDQHEFITFMMAAILNKPNANALAKGAGDADNYFNAATGLGIPFLKGFPFIGLAINGPKHFGKPVSQLSGDAYQAGFQLHLIEDNSPGGPHQFNDPGFGFRRAVKHIGQHILGDITGNSPDRAGKMGGWQAAWVALGGARGAFPFDLINTTVNFVNTNHLEIVGVQINGQSHGDVDFSNASLVQSSQQDGYQLNIYQLRSQNFYDDPNVQAILRKYNGMGANQMEEAERLYEYQVYKK